MALIDEIRRYTNLSHAHAWRMAAPNTPDEPALVSAFLSKEMYRGLRDSLHRHAPPSMNVLVRGVFTHQTPKVTLKGTAKSVEIGDLLLIRQHFVRDRRQPSSGKALLLQAKRNKKSKTGSLNSGNQKIQFDLYQRWPEFNGATRLDSAPYGATHWNFQNPSVGSEPFEDAAKYSTVFNGNAYAATVAQPPWKASLTHGPAYGALVKGRFPSNCSWATGACAPPPSSAKGGVNCAEDFAQTLLNFVQGREGRSFQPGVHGGSDHWSIFVNSMLAISAKPNGDYTYSSKSQSVVAGVRGRTLQFFDAVPALFLAADEELGAWVSREKPSLHDAFAFTNDLLRYTAPDFDEREPPSGEEPSVAMSIPGSGHVPVLLIASMGDEPEAYWKESSRLD